MIKFNFLLLTLVGFSFFGFSQNSCPDVDKRNNGNGQWSSAPGDFRPAYTQNNLVSANVVGTPFQFVKLNPNTKTGELTLKWDNLDVKLTPVITKVWYTDASGKTSLSSIVFGPPAPTKAGEDKVVYCFYGSNLPSSGTLSLEFTDPKTSIPKYFCSFDLKDFDYVKNRTITLGLPKITQQPLSKSELGDGTTSFTVTSTDAYQYKWQYSVNGTTWIDINNSDFVANNNTIYISNRIKYDDYSFRVILSNLYGTLTSNAATLTIDKLPTAVIDGAKLNCDVAALNGVKVNFTGLSPWSITYKINNQIPITISGISDSFYTIPLNETSDLSLSLVSISDKKYTNQLSENNLFNGYTKPTVRIENSIVSVLDSTISLNFNYTGNVDSYNVLNSSILTNSNKSITNTSFNVNGLVSGVYENSIKVFNSITGCESDIIDFSITVEESDITITKQPVDTAFYLLDGKAVIYGSALNSTSFQWQKSIDKGVTWQSVSGVDYLIFKDSLVINNRQSHNYELFRVIYSNRIDSDTSANCLLFVEQLPVAYFKSTVHCDVDILKAVPVLFEGTPPFELIYQVEGVPGEEAHFVPNIKTNTYNIIVGGLTKQTNIKLLKVNNRRYVNTNLTKDALFTSYKKNTLKSFFDTLVDDETKLFFKSTGNAYQKFTVVNGTTLFPNFSSTSGVISDSTVSFDIPNTGTTLGKFNFVITMQNENNTCYNTAKVYLTTIQNKLQIVTQPVSQTYLENGVATFTSTSKYATSFKWQYTINDGVTWNEIKQGGNFLKVTKDSLVINNRLFYKNNKFRVVLYGKFDNVTSNIVSLIVDRKPLAFFEGTKKCYTGKTKSTLIYLKGVAPFKISYSNDRGEVTNIANITKDVYTLTVDSTVSKLKLLTVSDSRFSDVALDSSNSVSFLVKPVYRPYFKSACLKDSLVELLFSGVSQPVTMTIKTGLNPIPGFAVLNDVAFSRGYKVNLPKNLAIGNYGFVISGNDGNCLSDEVRINLAMNAAPVMNVLANKTTINQGDSVELISTGANVVRWSPVSGIIDATKTSIFAKPETTTIYTVFGYQNGCVGNDTVKIAVNSFPTVSTCNPINLTVLSENIKNTSCNKEDGEVTFSISGGSENNKYRVRKKNDNGTYTILTNPAFAPLSNQNDETKTINLTGLKIGNYDIFAFCGNDSKVAKVFNFTITSPCDTLSNQDTTTNGSSTPINYDCTNMQLTIDNADIKPITCDYDFGSVSFSIQGGAPNFTYRLRRRNNDNSFSIITNPVFVSIGNKVNEPKKITIENLIEGDYELYVYCSQDVTYFKSLSFYIYKQGCRSPLKDVISYFTFDKNDNDSLKRASSPIITGAVKDFDNYGNASSAFKIYNTNDNLNFQNFIDIDTMNEYSISFWYKLLEMPKYNSSTLLTVPNGNQTQRFELSADKNGYLKVQFGKSLNSKSVYTNYKFEPSTWNQLVVTYRNDSSFVYVNDVNVASFQSEKLIDNNSNFVFGYDGYNKSLKFLIDEFKLYGRSINSTEVKENYFADVRENCTGIRLNIEVDGTKLKFVVSYGSSNNKYRLRKKNSSGVFVSIYDQTFVSIYNKVGESKAINTDNLAPGIYDIYAYCGTDSKKYQGFEFIVDNMGNASIYRKITPTETIEISNENAAEVKEEIFLNVYPNPVDNVINIDIIGADPTINKEIKLISSNGVLVHGESFVGSENSTSINVENFRAGVYILEVHLENNRIERKQIVIN